MSTKQHDKENKEHSAKTTPTNDVPQFFRLNIEVGDLKSAIRFIRTYSASKAASRPVRGATSIVAP